MNGSKFLCVLYLRKEMRIKTTYLVLIEIVDAISVSFSRHDITKGSPWTERWLYDAWFKLRFYVCISFFHGSEEKHGMEAF